MQSKNAQIRKCHATTTKKRFCSESDLETAPTKVASTIGSVQLQHGPRRSSSKIPKMRLNMTLDKKMTDRKSGNAACKARDQKTPYSGPFLEESWIHFWDTCSPKYFARFCIDFLSCLPKNAAMPVTWLRIVTTPYSHLLGEKVPHCVLRLQSLQTESLIANEKT